MFADYLWNAVLAFPIVMAFIPGLWPLALRGFVSLSQAPEWYKLAVEAALAFAFGRRGIETAAKVLIEMRRSRTSTHGPAPGSAN